MRRPTLLLLAYLSLFVTSALSAQSAKPADVLVVIHTVRGNLEKLYEASVQDVPSIPTLTLTPRKPRHVYRKASEVFAKAQTLRQLNGLKRNTLPTQPSSEITPSNVRDLVSEIAADIKALLPLYWTKASSGVPSKKDGVTPTDVYQGLNQLSFLIDGLGIPGVVPNDVHAVSRLVHQDMSAIYETKKGTAFAARALTPVAGKSPGDVYNKAFELLEAIKAQTLANESWSIPGGIIMPNRDSGAINPAKVMELTNNILAELGSIKVMSGVTASSSNDILSAGMTPSNVFDELAAAQVILDEMR